MANPFPFASGDVLTAAQLNSIGSWSQHTTTVTQGATTFGLSINKFYYTEVNDLVVCSVTWNINAGVGTSGQPIVFSVPFQPANAVYPFGSGLFYDNSVGLIYVVQVSWNGAIGAYMFADQSNGNVIGASPNIAGASGDNVRLTLAYEKA